MTAKTCLGAVLATVVVGASASPAGIAQRAGTLAFLRFPPDAWKHDIGGWSLFTIRADGSALRRLTPGDGRVYSYEWSPDGSRIAYTDGRGAVWVVRPDGTGRRRLAAGSGLASLALTWSPDGKALAVTAASPATKNWLTSPQQNWRIYIVPTDGGKQRRLPSGQAFSPAWSPRGDEIAYDSGSGRIWLIRSDGSKAHAVGDRGGGPRWSADGTHLGLVGGVRRGRIFDRYSAIYVADSDGSNFHLVTSRAYNEYGFAWSPGARRILYGRADREGIYVIDADGRNNHRVTRDSPIPVEWAALAWAPDGRSIAYDTDRTGNGDIYLIGADSRHRVQLTSSADTDVAPSWVAR